MHPFKMSGGSGAFTLAVLTAILLLALTGSAAAVTFPDVNAGDLYYDDIMCLAEEEIVGGFADGEFHPYWDVQRAQFAKIVVQAIGAHTASESWPGDPSDPSFPDAGPGATSLFDFIEEAAADYLDPPIIQGYTSGDFGPNDEIQRYQMALMIVRAAGASLEETPAGYPSAEDRFGDHAALAEIGDEALRAVYLLKFNGLVDGFEDGNFAPYAYTKRGQAAKVVCRMMTETAVVRPTVPEDPTPVDHTSFISSYEGPQTCESCHPGVTEDVADSLHFSMEEEEVPGFQGMSGRY